MSAATPIIVRSRAELQQYLWDHPIQLRAARPDRGPRVGHPDFIGPIDPRFMARIGRITFAADGTAEFILRKHRSEAGEALPEFAAVEAMSLASPLDASPRPTSGDENGGAL